MKDGTPLDPAAIASLTPGQANLTTVLAVAGAPDGVGWVESDDVLIYQSSRFRSTRWSLDNPASFVNRVTPQGFAGEAVAAALFTFGRLGKRLPQRPPPGRPIPQELPEMMQGWGKPLKLNGDQSGDERVQFFFDRETQILTRIEVCRGAPGNGTGDVATGVFLR